MSKIEKIDQINLESFYWVYLLEIAKKGGIGAYTPLTTVALGKLVGKSQQSASRYLTHLKEKGFLNKEKHKSSFKFMLTKKGEIEIMKIFNELSLIFPRSIERIINSQLDDKLKQNKIRMFKFYNSQPIKGFTQKEFKSRFPDPKDFYDSIEWKNCRIEILQRDEYTCQYCERKPSKQIHHLNDPRYCPELSLDPKNLIVLCNLCHKSWHLK